MYQSQTDVGKKLSHPIEMIQLIVVKLVKQQLIKLQNQAKPNSQMELLDYEQILPHQMKLFSSQGISLAKFVQDNHQNMYFAPQIEALPQYLHFRTNNEIELKKNHNNNLQAISLVMLRCIYQNNKNKDLLDHIKCSLYHKNLTFTKIKNSQYSCMLDISIKKILAQFFQLLNYGKDQVHHKLKKYSNVLELIVLYLRVILSHLGMPEALDSNSKISTQKAYDLLINYFDLNCKKIEKIYLFLEDGLFLSTVHQNFIVGDFIQNIKKKSEESDDNYSSDEQLINFVRPIPAEKNIREIKQIDFQQDLSDDSDIGNSTPSFSKVCVQSHNFQKKKNSNTQQTSSNQDTDASTPSFAIISDKQINFKPKIKVHECMAITQDDNEDQPQRAHNQELLKIPNISINRTQLWEKNMLTSQGSDAFDQNQQSIVQPIGQNIQNSQLPLLETSYRKLKEQKEATQKNQKIVQKSHKRAKSQCVDMFQKISLKKKNTYEQQQKKDIKPPPSFLFSPKKSQSPAKVEPQSTKDKKDLYEVVKEKKKQQKWLPFMFNKNKPYISSKQNQDQKIHYGEGKNQNKADIKVKNNNCNGSSTQDPETNNNKHSLSCMICHRRGKHNKIISNVVSFNFKPFSQIKSLSSFYTQHEEAKIGPKRQNSIIRSEQDSYVLHSSMQKQKIPTKIAKTSAIYWIQTDKKLISSAPINGYPSKVIFSYPLSNPIKKESKASSSIYQPIYYP